MEIDLDLYIKFLLWYTILILNLEMTLTLALTQNNKFGMKIYIIYVQYVQYKV